MRIRQPPTRHHVADSQQVRHPTEYIVCMTHAMKDIKELLADLVRYAAKVGLKGNTNYNYNARISSTHSGSRWKARQSRRWIGLCNWETQSPRKEEHDDVQNRVG
jgi:hypothetical protein